MSESNKVSVLFVCLGNICRSTMAEAVFRSVAKSSPLIAEIDSAATSAYNILNPPDCRTMSTLRRHGITDYDHEARQVTTDDFNDFDYIFAMDSNNLRSLKRLQGTADRRGKTKAQVMLFGEYGGVRMAEEVEDPYYGADNGFETVYEQVLRFSKNFLEDLNSK